jgi:hypothetical protein
LKSCRNPDLLNSELDAHPWAWSTYRQPLLLTAQVRFHEAMLERFWIPLELRLALPTVAPGQTPGALRFVSLALHILPQ